MGNRISENSYPSDAELSALITEVETWELHRAPSYLTDELMEKADAQDLAQKKADRVRKIYRAEILLATAAAILLLLLLPAPTPQLSAQYAAGKAAAAERRSEVRKKQDDFFSSLADLNQYIVGEWSRLGDWVLFQETRS